MTVSLEELKGWWGVRPHEIIVTRGKWVTKIIVLEVNVNKIEDEKEREKIGGHIGRKRTGSGTRGGRLIVKLRDKIIVT